MTAVPAAAAARRLEAVVCPFCALACDDLLVTAEGSDLISTAHGCERATAAFGATRLPALPRIDGEPTTMEAALDRAAALLARSRLPLFAGLGTDTAAMREVLALADGLGGIVDHARAAGLMANLEAMRATGWVTGTLAELKSRADLVLLVGGEIDSLAPRLAERLLRPTSMLGPGTPATRRLVALGAGTAATRMDEHLPCPPDRLPEVLAALRALVAGRQIGPLTSEAPPIEALRALARALGEARYAAIVWSLAGLDSTQASLVAWTLAELTKELNVRGGTGQENRAIGVPLAGAGNVIGANQVTAWQTGLPLRTSLATGVPDHAPLGHAAAGLLERGQVDLCCWIDAFGDAPRPAFHGAPRLELTAGMEPAVEGAPAAVSIPVGIPGLDHAGTIYRSDGVVSLPVRALRASDLPSVAEVLRAIAARLPSAMAGQPGPRN